MTLKIGKKIRTLVLGILVLMFCMIAACGSCANVAHAEESGDQEEQEGEITTYAMPGGSVVKLYKYASSTKTPYIGEWDIFHTNVAAHRTLFITVEDEGNQYISYCLDYGLKSRSTTNMTSTNIDSLGAAQAQQIKAALTFGYNTPVAEANMTDRVKAQFGATQAMIYCIRAGIFGQPSMNTTAAAYLNCFADSGEAKNYFNSLAHKISTYTKIPGFTGASAANAPTHMLTWNAEKERYEKQVTLEQDLVGLCNFTNDKGITFEGNGTTMTISSKEPIPVKVTGSGRRSDLGVRSAAVYYWNGNAAFQKLTSVDLGSGLNYANFYYAVQTELPTFQVEKTDTDTGEMVPDTEFQVTAAEDIKTPDGRTQVKKDEVVQEVVTGEDGRVTTKPLYPGNYTVKETRPAQGYSIGEETQNIELKYQKEETKVAAMANHPTKVKLTKIVKGKDEKLSGVEFEVEKMEDPASDEESGENVDEGMKKQVKERVQEEDGGREQGIRR